MGRDAEGPGVVVKPLYALVFRVATWASYTTFDLSLPTSWAWAINVRAVRVAEWSWKRWLRLASEGV